MITRNALSRWTRRTAAYLAGTALLYLTVTAHLSRGMAVIGYTAAIALSAGYIVVVAPARALSSALIAATALIFASAFVARVVLRVRKTAPSAQSSTRSWAPQELR